MVEEVTSGRVCFTIYQMYWSILIPKPPSFLSLAVHASNRKQEQGSRNETMMHTVKAFELLQPKFGHLSCMSVVQCKNIFNLNHSVVERLLPFLKLESFCRKPSISGGVCCFFSLTHLLLRSSLVAWLQQKCPECSQIGLSDWLKQKKKLFNKLNFKKTYMYIFEAQNNSGFRPSLAGKHVVSHQTCSGYVTTSCQY